jgi:hypothetical protein
VTTNVGKDVGIKEPSYSADGKTIWRLLKKLKIDLLYDPAIPLLGIYPKECDSGYSRGTCTLIKRKCGSDTQWNFI